MKDPGVFVSYNDFTERVVDVKAPVGNDAKFTVRIGAFSLRLAPEVMEELVGRLTTAQHTYVMEKWGNERVECGAAITYAWDSIGACTLPMGHAGRHAVRMEG